MKRAALPARLAYIVVIALATLSEPTLPAAAPQVGERLERALSPALRRVDAVDAVRNVVLFAGWGAVWTITAEAGRAWPIVARATAAGMLISIGAETMQLLTPGRSPSVLDVFTNGAGAFLGALGLAVLIVLLRAGRGQRSYLGQPLIVFGAGYAAAVLLDAFSPLLAVDRIAGAWGTAGERLGMALRDASARSLGDFALFDLLLAAPAGGLLVAALAEMHVSRARAALMISLAAPVAFLLVELARGAAGYPLSPGGVLARSAGVALGAWATVRALPRLTQALRGAARPLAFIAAYVLVLAAWALRPFSPEFETAWIRAKLTVDRFIPLKIYRENVGVFAAADALLPVCLFLPLGALLAIWPLRRRGPLSGVLPALYLAAVLEGTQIFVMGQLFDITELLIAWAALVLGWAAARRAGLRPYGEALSALPDEPAAAAPR